MSSGRTISEKVWEKVKDIPKAERKRCYVVIMDVHDAREFAKETALMIERLSMSGCLEETIYESIMGGTYPGETLLGMPVLIRGGPIRVMKEVP